MFNPLLTVSPLDGKYKKETQDLSDFFSEFALYKYRLKVELEWFIFVCNTIKIEGSREISDEEIAFLKDIVDYFDIASAENVKHIENETQNEERVIEYYLKEAISNSTLADLTEFIHLASSNDDILSCSYSMAIKASRDRVATNYLLKLINKLKDLAKIYHNTIFINSNREEDLNISTIGKEFLNFISRLEYFYEKIQTHQFKAKFSGKGGNFTSHFFIKKTDKWPDYSKNFLSSLGLEINKSSNLGEALDNINEYLLYYSQINIILSSLIQKIVELIKRKILQAKKQTRDLSQYVINKSKIDSLEEIEGNLVLSNSLINTFTRKLSSAGLVEDSDKFIILRNIGSIFAYSSLSYQGILRVLDNLEIKQEKIESEISRTPEIILEAIQTILILEGKAKAYEQIQEQTRGRNLKIEELREIIQNLDISEKNKEKLSKLEAKDYIGLASELTLKYLNQKL